MAIFRSPTPDVEVPDISLTECVLGQAEAWGDRAAIVDVDTDLGWTYRDLARDVARVAAGLRRRGLRHGDVVGLMSGNDAAFPLAFHGIAAAGGVVTTLNPVYTETEIAHQLKDAGATLVLASPATAATVARAVPALDVLTVAATQTPVITELLGVGPARGGDIDALRADDVAALRADDLAAPRADDLVALPYSSGTTGLPKGVKLTHRNLVANVLQSAATQAITPDDRIAAVLPFYHIYGLTTILNVSLSQGATVVSFPRFDASAFLAQLARQRVTRLFAVPPIILSMLNDPTIAQHDLSALQTVLSGAAPLAEDIANRCAERIGVAVSQGYGLTEASPATHLTPRYDSGVPAGSIGYLLPNTEAKVLDVDSGAELEAGEEGELCLRGPQVMAGYLNNPEATARTLDGDAFLHTGDIARVTEQGHWFIVDRVKELIKYKGYQVPPAELEAILLAHDAVSDAAVIGIPDPAAGELPKAFVSLLTPVDEADLMAYVNARVAPYKKLRALEIIEVIPRSGSGKILRRVLRDAKPSTS